MDLRVSNRTIWIVSPRVEVARAIASVALEEGARVAVFSPGAAQVVRPLRSRFGLRALACATPAAAERGGRDLQAAAQWGGPPFGLMIHAVGPAPLAAHHAELQAFCQELSPDGAVLIMRAIEGGEADDAELAQILEGDLDVARTFVRSETRVSVVGCLAPFSLADPACGALAVFSIGRGGPALALIGKDGLIHAAPSASA